MTKIGHYAFLIGVILAIITGFFPDTVMYSALVLVILGLVVGFINITAKETHGFLVASIALMVAGGAGLGVIPWNVGGYLVSILTNIVIFVAPAAIVVALKTVVALATE
ncbi:hypothetical protein KY340_03785 [Candidatus Woesearchaeota archaeon]|nr:hypothetical protein [Candidatus Woesearchaeota archaeon]